jgi:hypothetical protein
MAYSVELVEAHLARPAACAGPWPASGVCAPYDCRIANALGALRSAELLHDVWHEMRLARESAPVAAES